MSNVWCIGITGGIGSGKSFICRQLEAAGHPVFYCDPEAKRIIRTHPQVQAELTALIGSGLYDAQRQLVKSVLASYLCRGKAYASRVDAIVHPRVAEAFSLCVAQCVRQNALSTAPSDCHQPLHGVQSASLHKSSALPAECLSAVLDASSQTAVPASGRPVKLTVEQLAALPVGNVVFMECALLFESGFDKLVDCSVLVHVSAATQLSRLMLRDGISREQAQAWIDLQLSETDKLQRADFVIHNE